MFTSRAEYRMMLRYSNAETRLYQSAIKHCLLSVEEKTVIEKRFKDRENIKKLTSQSIKSDYLDAFNIKQSLPIKDYIKRPEANLFGTLKKLIYFQKQQKILGHLLIQHYLKEPQKKILIKTLFYLDLIIN